MKERRKKKRLEFILHVIVIFLVYLFADKICEAIGFEKIWQYILVLLIVVLVGVVVEQLILSLIKNSAFFRKHFDETEDEE